MELKRTYTPLSVAVRWAARAATLGSFQPLSLSDALLWWHHSPLPGVSADPRFTKAALGSERRLHFFQTRRWKVQFRGERLSGFRRILVFPDQPVFQGLDWHLFICVLKHCWFKSSHGRWKYSMAWCACLQTFTCFKSQRGKQAQILTFDPTVTPCVYF